MSENRRLLALRELVDDDAFDALLSAEARRRAGSYWSRVDVAQTAARWFASAGATRILDVGAGPGKFCIIASLTTGRRVWGLERRASLVAEGRRLATQLKADVVLHEGTLRDADIAGFDGLYFYNPFGEYLADDKDRFDGEAPRSIHEYLADVRTVERWLRDLPPRSVMVTYNGLGGRIPVSWESRLTEEHHGDVLRLWVKAKPDESDDAYIEVGEQLVPASALARLAARRGAGEDTSLVSQLVKPLP